MLLNECFVEIYHDIVKDMPTRPMFRKSTYVRKENPTLMYSQDVIIGSTSSILSNEYDFKKLKRTDS